MTRRIVVLAVVLAVSGCGDQPPTSGNLAGHDVATLFQPGPHDVGYLETTISYRPPGETEDRSLPVHVWYPAVADSGSESQVYKLAGIVDLPSGGALTEPPLAGGDLPIAVYSHGSGSEGVLAYPLAEMLASDGWLVLAPDHVGNTARAALSGDISSYAQNIVQRPLDITAVLDAVGSGLDAPVGTAGDLDRVLLIGHSYGGYTTLAVAGAGPDFDGLATNSCRSGAGDGSCDYVGNAEVEAQVRAGFLDDRLDAIVLQAPALLQIIPDGALSAITLPALLQSGQQDVTLPNDAHAVPVWNGLDGQDDLWVQMPAGAHYTFLSICTDLRPDLLSTFVPDALEDGCGPDAIPTTEALPVLTAYTRAFANQHVLGLSGWTEIIVGDPLAEGFTVQSR